MSNDRYVQAWFNFGNDRYLQAASAGPFNPGGGAFLAAALFKFSGVSFPSNETPFTVPQFLWGNHDSNFNGWKLTLESGENYGDMNLVATIGEGGGDWALDYPLVIAGESSEIPGLAERLIFAAMYYSDVDGERVFELFINGNRVARKEPPSPYSPSGVAPRVGRAVADDNNAQVEIAGVAFTQSVPLTGPGAAQQLMVGTWKEVREQNKIGLLLNFPAGLGQACIDWDHRYNAEIAPGQPNALTLGPNGVYAYTRQTRAAASVPDDGNRGFNALPGVAAVSLNIVGNADDLYVSTTRNANWYTGGAPFVQGAG